LQFDEVAILLEMRKGLMKTTGCKEVNVVEVGEENREGLSSVAEHAIPGQPSFLFENVEE